jgi:hypothetical protein
MFAAGAVMFPPGTPGTLDMFAAGVLTSAEVSLTGAAVVTTVAAAVVAGAADGDELVQPVIRIMPIRKTATADAMQAERFWPEMVLRNEEIEFMCTPLVHSIPHL